MKAVVALLLGIAYSHPYGPLDMELAWKEEITFDWENLDHASSFKNWQQEFGKVYKDAEEEGERFIVFLDNWKRVNDHNVRARHSYTMKLNQFGDLTAEEFKLAVHGHTGSCLRKRSVQERVVMEEYTPKAYAVPDSIDWTNYEGKSYVTPVKNQGQCGSCWAFSTTGSIESRNAIANQVTGDDITTLSEQQLVDCSTKEGNQGCNGGLMDDAFKYVESEGGLCSEEEYPYEAKDGTCRSTSCGTKYDAISGYQDVKAESEESLQAAVAEGPVSIAIEADQTAFQFYSTGVMDGRCGTRLDHGVLVVGYGTDDGQDYWKVKNSWGDSWGEEGYIRMCRNCDKNGNDGECGILMTPSYPEE